MVIVIVEKDRTVFGYCAGLYGKANCDQNDALLEENLPFAKIAGHKDAIIMNCGYYRELNFVRYLLDFPKSSCIDEEYIHKNIVPQIKDRFSERGYLNDNGEMNSDLYIAQGNTCYNITPAFSSSTITDYYAMEGNAGAAMALLEESKGMEVYSRIKFVFETIEKMDGVRLFPIVTIDTKSKKIKVVEK